MTNTQFENEKNEVLTELINGGFIRLSTTRPNLFKLMKENNTPLNYYPLRLLNNLIDEKKVVFLGGKFIYSNQNF